MGVRQHFLPAAFLGGFSADTCGPSRERILWVARRDGGVYREKAENVAYQRDLYTLKTSPYAGSDPLSVDRHLSAPEPKLGAAIEALYALRDGWLPADAWQVMVSFITSLFVRGPEFKKRFEGRMVPAITEFVHADNTTMARVIEQQRLFAPVMYAGWIALRPLGHTIITNDLGYLPTFDIGASRCGYCVPLRSDILVGLFARPVGQTMAWRNGAWAVDIPVRPLAAAGVQDLNRHVACNALNEVYGDTRDVVEQARIGFADEPPQHGWGPGLLVPSGQALREHELDYMRMLGAIASPPPEGISQWLMGWPQRTNWSAYEELIAAMSSQ